MAPVWYYSRDIHGECFTVYVDGSHCAKKYWFRATNGRFVDAVNGGKDSSPEKAFRLDFLSAQRLGPLEEVPNLQLALREGRLPANVLKELRRMKNASLGQ